MDASMNEIGAPEPHFERQKNPGKDDVYDVTTLLQMGELELLHLETSWSCSQK